MNLIFGTRFDEPGHDYHVIHKAVANASLYRDDADRERYVRMLRTVQSTQDASMQAMGLMTNHSHGMLGVRKASHSNFMQRWGGMYASSFNLRHKREGHLLGEPFWSRPILSAIQYLATLRYILLNPFVAGIVRSLDALAAYPWTSLGALLGRTSRTVQEPDVVLAHFADDPDEARHLLMMWLSYSADFDPYAAIPCPVALEQVERIQSRAFRDAYERARVQYDARRVLTLEDISKWTCERIGVSESLLLTGSRVPPLPTARAIVVFLAVDVLGLSQSSVGRHLGVTQSGVYRALPRGRAAFEDRFGDASLARDLLVPR